MEVGGLETPGQVVPNKQWWRYWIAVIMKILFLSMSLLTMLPIYRAKPVTMLKALAWAYAHK
jgi:hypothetical protein